MFCRSERMTAMAGFLGSEYAEYSSAPTATRSPASRITTGTSARSPRIARQPPLSLTDDRHHLAAHNTEDRTETPSRQARSEEHTSELQSHSDLVCRLLLEKKKKIILPCFIPTQKYRTKIKR